jgi:hypothetical protein
MRPRSILLAVQAFKMAMGLALIATLIAPGSVLAGPSEIVKVDGTNLDCSLESATATADLIGVTRIRTDGGSFGFIDLGIEPKDPAASLVAGGMDDPQLTPSGVQATFEMVNPLTDELIGSATVSATFTLTGSQRFRRVLQNTVQKGIFNDLTVSGTIKVTTEAATYAFDMAGCVASSQARMDQHHDPNGPKPGGAAPANDTPAGALAVAAGSHLQVDTGGASLQPEATCLVTFQGEVFAFDWGRTAWFSFRGTGNPITFDPGGSTFDTVVAAYASSGSDLEQVGCVDDDSNIGSTQGHLMFDTELGVTYLVQIGGVNSDDPEFGQLRLSVY